MAEKFSFEPDSSGRRLTEIFAELGINLDTRCAEMGKCGGCSVDLLEGELVNIHTGDIVRGEQRAYACLHSLSADSAAVISVPEKSIIAKKSSAVSEFRIISELVRDFPERTDNERDYSIAIDVGTTTVAVMLVRIGDAAVIGTRTAFNGQIKYGDNVLTRIKHCQSDPAMVQTLQNEIMRLTLLPLMEGLLKDSSVSFSQVQEVVIAGNTTMLHLCAGVNPETLGVSPFTPVFTESRVLSLEDAFDVSGFECGVILLPSVSAYLGADVLAGALISGVLENDKPQVIVDVGTNGEMILNTGKVLAGCSTAAGPAFEGAGLSSGTRAADGAVSHMRLSEGKVELEVIGHEAKPVGICGTAYFDFFASAVAEGLLNAAGRFTEGFAGNYPKYVRKGDNGMEFCLLGIDAADSPKITEADISSLLQAKAAVAAGLETMLSRYDLEAEDLDRVYLAGGFGMYLNVDSALSCGLLPGVVREQVELVGNTSLAGAYMAVDKPRTISFLAEQSDVIEVVELNLDEDFEDYYIDNMLLPC